jgi:hypothetical protein
VWGEDATPPHTAAMAPVGRRPVGRPDLQRPTARCHRPGAVRRADPPAPRHGGRPACAGRLRRPSGTTSVSAAPPSSPCTARPPQSPPSSAPLSGRRARPERRRTDGGVDRYGPGRRAGAPVGLFGRSLLESLIFPSGPLRSSRATGSRSATRWCGGSASPSAPAPAADTIRPLWHAPALQTGRSVRDRRAGRRTQRRR